MGYVGYRTRTVIEERLCRKAFGQGAHGVVETFYIRRPALEYILVRARRRRPACTHARGADRDRGLQ